jgi:hypothetical protein
MGYYGIDADTAFALLKRWSQSSNTKLREINYERSAASWSTPPPAKLLCPPHRIGFFAKLSSAYNAAARATEWAAASQLDRTLLDEWVPLPFRLRRHSSAPFSAHGRADARICRSPQVRIDNPRSSSPIRSTDSRAPSHALSLIGLYRPGGLPCRLGLLDIAGSGRSTRGASEWT